MENIAQRTIKHKHIHIVDINLLKNNFGFMRMLPIIIVREYFIKMKYQVPLVQTSSFECVHREANTLNMGQKLL